MNTQKWFLVLIAVSLVALIGSAAGCGAAAPGTPAAKPTINSFAISPTSISQGQQTTLSWNVSGATTVTIQPNIKTAGATGSLTLTPNATVTYTLTANNEAGSSTSSATVNVTPVVAGKADLVITDLYLIASQWYYKIKNQGNAVATPTETDLYVGAVDEASQKVFWFKETSNYVDMLAPGEERIQRFTNFDWRYEITDPERGFITLNVKACANADNAITESNENNNCLITVLGPDFIYDFVKQGHLAKWTSGAGTLFSWPMSSMDVKGAAYSITYNPVLVICPEQVNNGWITGKFGDFYYDRVTLMPLVRDINIPVLAQFTSKVGFAPGTTSPDGVTVALGYFDDMGSLVFFDKMPVMSDGQMHDYNVDLGFLAGKHTQFVLLVQANGSPQGNCVRWQEPKITIEEQP